MLHALHRNLMQLSAWPAGGHCALSLHSGICMRAQLDWASLPFMLQDASGVHFAYSSVLHYQCARVETCSAHMHCQKQPASMQAHTTRQVWIPAPNNGRAFAQLSSNSSCCPSSTPHTRFVADVALRCGARARALNFGYPQLSGL